MHVDFVDENVSQSATIETPKCQFGTLNCTLEELAILELIVKILLLSNKNWQMHQENHLER